jgi:hypothetical protein
MTDQTAHTKRTHIVAIKAIDEEKRIVYGEVYAPNRLDTYGEFMLADDIELMAHRFMQLPLHQTIDTQHDNIPNGSYPVESFVAREGDPDYTPGAWVMGVKVPDDRTWKAVKSGQLNGFSFEAMVLSVEMDVEYLVVRDHVGSVEPAMDHDHAYFVQMDEAGQVVGGYTSPGPDGHVHKIKRASLTEKTNDHTHRFFL